MRSGTLLLVVAISRTVAQGQVVLSEFFSDPVTEGWVLVQQFCDPETWNHDGLYHQVLDFEACGPPPGGGQDSYARTIGEFNGVANWFCELRVETTGSRSEIPGGAPIVLAAGNAFGIGYNATIARDQAKLFRDVDVPVLFIEIDPGVPHTIRLKLNNEGTATYRWYIDGVMVDEGFAIGPYPSDDARITWRGKAWFEPSENVWDYIRYGIPSETPGDFDSDGDVDDRDFFYFAECVGRRGNGPNVPSDPGCTWADMDHDGNVDFHDFALFQLAFAAPE